MSRTSSAATLAFLFFAIVGSPIMAQEAAVDQKQVDAAVKKAVAYLKVYSAKVHGEHRAKVPWVDPAWVDELVLLTFIHAGVPQDDPDFQKLFQFMLERKYTAKERRLLYPVVFQAMILEEVDRVKFQDRIQQCAQWLVDSQCQNGQWDPWGTPSALVEEMNEKLTSSIKDLPPYQSSGPWVPFPKRPKPKVVQTVEVKKLHKGGIGGDNGASYFAALGLRACIDAGVIVPKEVLVNARKWWIDSQPGHPLGKATKGMGWCYCEKRAPNFKCTAAYGSATAGGICALTIYDHLLGIDSKKNDSIQQALAWVASQPSLTMDQDWYYSHFFAVQNAGTLLGTEKLGEHQWYALVAKALLATQTETGAWPQKHPPHKWLEISDACFAILFLKQSARPLERRN